MGKIKSPLKQLEEKGIIGKPIDLDPDWYRKHLEEEKKAKEDARLKEQKRIDNIKCPSCKSTNKKHVIKSESNGIFGPGYRSWVTEEYFVCLECGTMFKDLEKLK